MRSVNDIFSNAPMVARHVRVGLCAVTMDDNAHGVVLPSCARSCCLLPANITVNDWSNIAAVKAAADAIDGQ